MPSTSAVSVCLEASRAAALAAHSAAGLSAAAGFRDAARLLRSSEALARAATSVLSSLALKTTPTRSGAGLPAGQVAAAPPDASTAGAAAAAGLGKKKKKKKKERVNSENKGLVGSLAADVTAGALAPTQTFQMSPHAPAFAPGAAAAPARVLEKKSSRERSPRRGPSQMQLSPSSASPSTAISLATNAGEDGFSVGQAALLTGLVSRPELAGCHVTLRSFDVASSRWAVAIDTSGESIRV
jgi:hypothetical protein